ncbi:DnaJ C-terminal domain-containing protein [Sinorhizobium fredii]|uniref:DnaJ C-terminal domain-containing protein n=1 Tax=Rhizobium fredii TaxID=380 RepID=UPI0004B976B9|nr:J domain-containing protein [Sinorhizobium fredii]AWM27737.1 DnaJ-class molecular chaperone CbpA [Sinorhizobium fredii CCBAU 25509]
MANDPYETLGVAKNATQKEIQSAYRKLAKKLHPDLNPGDKNAEDRFKEASAAYALLGDEEKRARFDKGEIDATGAEQAARNYYKEYAATPGADTRYQSTSGFSDFGEADDIFSSFFSRRGHGQTHARGRDLHFAMEVDFLEAVNGAKKQITLPDRTTLDLQIPPGTQDGQLLRLRGKGEPGPGGGPAGDALIEVHVRPHPIFTRDGDDIRIEMPISLREAILGGKVLVPTISGNVTLTLPPNSSTGKTLRLKGKGVTKRGGGSGDQYITVKVILPDPADPDLAAFATSWSAGEAQNPRRAWGG